MANEEHVKILKQGVETWNAWCDANLNQRRANLSFAELSNAHLRGANLTQARLYENSFVNVDLASVIGLDACVHEGPSTVDHRTLQKSGPLPLAFLRGVGLPDMLNRLSAFAAEQ